MQKNLQIWEELQLWVIFHAAHLYIVLIEIDNI